MEKTKRSMVPVLLMIEGLLLASMALIFIMVMTKTQGLFVEFGVDTGGQLATMVFINVTLAVVAIADFVYGLKLSLAQKTKALSNKQRNVGVFLLLISMVIFVFMVPGIAISVMGPIYSLSSGF